MKIGFLMQQGVEIRRPPFDGPANHVREVLAELVNRGHTVRVVAGLDGQIWCSDDLAHFQPVPPTWLDHGPPRLFERAVRRVQSELKLPYAALFDSWRFALACCQALRECDVLFERMSWMGYGGSLAAAWLRRPLVSEYNGDHLHDLEAKGIAPTGLQKRLSIAIMRAIARRATHVIATGEGWRDHFIRTWHYGPARISVVENGTAVVRLLRREQLQAFQADSQAQQPVTIVYLGAFYPWHGVSILLRAFERALRTARPLRLMLIGSGVGEAEARQQIAGSGLEAQVCLLGQLAASDYAVKLAQADIGVAPYCGWKEFSGLKLFDYKAAGLAIIASGQDGKPTTLSHERTAVIVPPCDEDALAAALVRLARDEGLRRRLGQAARLEAEQCHGWDRTAAQLEQVFARVTGTENAAGHNP
jgi:glycosyltransferase involved in cell wall biosynthesis